MRNKIPSDLTLIDILILMLVLVIIISPTSSLRVILGLPFTMFFPGYALLAALFPRKSDLDIVERLALSLGLSIAAVTLIALALNYTRWGVKLYPLLVSESVFTVVSSFFAWYRCRRLAGAERINLSLNPVLFEMKNIWKNKKPVERVLSVILTIVIIATLGTLGYAMAKPRVGERFTEFYLLGTSGKVADYPREIRLSGIVNVTAGIINREDEEVSYRIEVRESGIVIRELGLVTLQHEQKWEQSVEIIPTVVGENQKLDFLLFKVKAEDDKLYQSLHIWLNVR